MRFAFVADLPDWALSRQGLGLVRYGAVDGHSWTLHHLRPRDFDDGELEQYDAVRIGGAPLVEVMRTHELLPSRPKLVVSLASFRDEATSRDELELLGDRLAGIMTVDHRLLRDCARYRAPCFHFPDRTDPMTFHPQPELRPRRGPLRVGWAGSTAWWGPIKHVDLIAEACRLVGRRRVVYVRQDRERDGRLDAQGMARWFNGIDVYVAANDEDTPTPVPWIEAAACGVAVVGTRCGELWPLLEGLDPRMVLAEPSVDALTAALTHCVRLGRRRLHRLGAAFLAQHAYHLHWERSYTVEFTRFVAALCGEQ